MPHRLQGCRQKISLEQLLWLIIAVIAAFLLLAAAPSSWASADPPPVPAIVNLAPDNGPPSGGTSVTITGSGFTGATAVAFGASYAESFVVESDTTITAVSPPKPGYWGIAHVTVIGPGGTSVIGPQDRFGYGTILDTMTPSGGSPAGGTPVTLNGFGLEEATAVNFGSAPATSFDENPDGTITAISPPVSAGETIAAVEVVTPEGHSMTYTVPDAEPANFFSYAPTVADVEPSEGPEAGGTTVTIRGSGFTSAPVSFRGLVGPFVHGISFGAVELHCGQPWPAWYAPCGSSGFTVVSDSEIIAATPPGTGTVDVGVLTDGGPSDVSATDQFTYIPPSKVLNQRAQLRIDCVAFRHAAGTAQRRDRENRRAIRRICVRKLTSSGSGSAGVLVARLERGRVLYARGTARQIGRSRIQMALEALKPVEPGRYRLTLRRSSSRGPLAPGLRRSERIVIH